jgi:lipopolysaccharide biosynthesis glycosyltransferase
MSVSQYLRPPIVLVFSGNENYALGLTVTAASLLEHLPRGRRVRIYILEGTFQPETKRKIQQSLSRWNTDLRFVKPDIARLEGLKLTQGMQPEVYFRLQAGELLPGENRALYLDSDMLVLDDVTTLWETDLQGKTFGAVQDVLISPTIKAIPNYQTLNLDPEASYYSSGLMLIDLRKWRAEKVGERVIRHIAEHPETVRWWDQDGLNAVARDWLPLDVRWNSYGEAAHLYGWVPDPCMTAFTEDLLRHQKIVHFSTRYKPWKHNCLHPKAAAWYETLDRTAFAGWRPDPSTEIPHPPQQLS